MLERKVCASAVTWLVAEVVKPRLTLLSPLCLRLVPARVPLLFTLAEKLPVLYPRVDFTHCVKVVSSLP